MRSWSISFCCNSSGAVSFFLFLLFNFPFFYCDGYRTNVFVTLDIPIAQRWHTFSLWMRNIGICCISSLIRLDVTTPDVLARFSRFISLHFMTQLGKLTRSIEN